MQIEGHLDCDDLSVSEDRCLNREYLMDKRERTRYLTASGDNSNRL